MSIKVSDFWMLFMMLALVIFFNTFAFGQQLEATVTVTNLNSIKIQGSLKEKKLSSDEKNWSFLQSVAGIENLSARISDLKLFDEFEKEISYRQLKMFPYQKQLSKLISADRQ